MEPVPLSCSGIALVLFAVEVAKARDEMTSVVRPLVDDDVASFAAQTSVISNVAQPAQ